MRRRWGWRDDRRMGTCVCRKGWSCDFEAEVSANHVGEGRLAVGSCLVGARVYTGVILVIT